MTQTLYDIYFTGQLVEGVDQASAQKNLAILFKSNIENIARLFNGKPQVLKRGVDKTAALKYKAALHKAGVLVAFKAHQVTAASNSVDETSTVNPATQQHIHTDTLTLAPVGSNVLNEDEKPVVEAPVINTDGIKLVSAFADLSPPEKELPPAPDTSHISLAETGADLAVDHPQSPPLELDLDDFSIAPLGADLEQLPDNRPVVNPNTSGISIAPAGANLMPNPPKKKSITIPDTDHISIVQD